MRTYNFFISLFFLLAIGACDKDDNTTRKPDFSVLGITTITINDTDYSIKGHVLMAVDDVPNIAVVGTQLANSSYTVEYTVIQETQAMPAVSAVSSCNDVSIDTDTDTTTEGLTCITLHISRAGYDEQATYKFYFMRFESQG